MEDLIDLLLVRLDDNSTYRTANLPRSEVVEMSPRGLTREHYSGSPERLPAGWAGASSPRPEPMARCPTG